jgi:apoptosis-inducing factor 2
MTERSLTQFVTPTNFVRDTYRTSHELRTGEHTLATVAIIGGGYGGAAAAKALDDIADVVLIDPKDAFVHNIAALRGLVDPEWTERVFYPYRRLLTRGRVVQDRAIRVDADAVTIGTGERIPADYIVLASGSTYPFPAKMGVNDSATAKAKIATTRSELAKADRVLLLGAGPVGLELSGEIKAAWPEKEVTLVDPIDDVLSGHYTDQLRQELRRQLDELGVNLLLGTKLVEEPQTAPGVAGIITAFTTSGQQITADIWFRCYGLVPNSDYLSEELASARLPNGHLEVTPELRLAGQETVFAIGDITAIPESKRGGAAGRHAQVAAGNIRALIEGRDELTAYQPAPPLILLPLGPTGGVSQLPGRDFVGAEETAQIKGHDMFVGNYAELFNVTPQGT